MASSHDGSASPSGGGMPARKGKAGLISAPSWVRRRPGRPDGETIESPRGKHGELHSPPTLPRLSSQRLRPMLALSTPRDLSRPTHEDKAGPVEGQAGVRGAQECASALLPRGRLRLAHGPTLVAESALQDCQSRTLATGHRGLSAGGYWSGGCERLGACGLPYGGVGPGLRLPQGGLQWGYLAPLFVGGPEVFRFPGSEDRMEKGRDAPSGKVD